MRPLRNFFRRRPDVEQFLANLTAAHPGKNYSRKDRYRDFRMVFMETEQGRRVLCEIMAFGHMYQSSANLAKFDTNKTFFHDGERNVALRIMTTLNAEPVDLPAKANVKEE